MIVFSFFFLFVAGCTVYGATEFSVLVTDEDGTFTLADWWARSYAAPFSCGGSNVGPRILNFTATTVDGTDDNQASPTSGQQITYSGKVEVLWRVYRLEASQANGNRGEERGEFFTWGLTLDPSTSAASTKTYSAQLPDAVQGLLGPVARLAGPGVYEVDMWARAFRIDGQETATINYDNFGAHDQFRQLTAQDSGDGTCTRGPWGMIVKKDEVDGQVRFVEGFACTDNATDVVSLELWRGFPGDAKIADLTANVEKLGDTDVLSGTPGNVYPWITTLCGGRQHLFRRAWDFRTDFPTAGLFLLSLKLTDPRGQTGDRWHVNAGHIEVPACSGGKGGAEGCSGHGTCYGPTTAGSCRCDKFWAGDDCSFDVAGNANALPTIISLNAAYRVFTPADADFSCCPGTGVEANLVLPQLGPDNKPVYNNASTPCGLSANQCGVSASPSHSTHGPAAFHQWYNSPIVLNSTLDLFLINSTALLYGVEMPQFFPVDQAAAPTFPTVDPDHVYHFTTEIEAEFVYWPGQVFEFFGDDDLWVFIDGQLRLDLGGTHVAVAGSINLDSLGFTVGSIHALHIFHAERYCCGSSFKLTTSLCFNTCPGSFCRPNEAVCESLSVPCKEFSCVEGAKKRRKKRALDAELEKDIFNVTIPADCAVRIKETFPCDLDGDACTKDTCSATGVCVKGENECATGQTETFPITPGPTPSPTFFNANQYTVDADSTGTETDADTSEETTAASGNVIANGCAKLDLFLPLLFAPFFI